MAGAMALAEKSLAGVEGADMSRSAAGQNWDDIYYSSSDGLRLHARHYPVESSGRRAVLCLPGLTRNARDFHIIASYLNDPTRHRRDVYVLDYRGRGLSDFDTDWRNYSPYIEMLDVLDFMAMKQLHDVAVIGTSRGGIIAMIMATLRPTSIGALVLNDIGPVIEPEGLTRIIGYVGKIPVPNNWQEATELTKSINQRDFPKIRDNQWEEFARQLYNDDNGAPSSSYDPNLSKAITMLDPETDIPAMWPQFDALSTIPVMAVRGANSDLLSPQTLEKMKIHHPELKTHIVADQGHAPLLHDQESIEAIAHFLIETDGVKRTNRSKHNAA